MNITHIQNEFLMLDEDFNCITLNKTKLKSEQDESSQLPPVNFSEEYIEDETSNYILGYN